MLNNIDALSTKSVMVVEMIASRLSSVITRQLDWWYYWGKTAEIMTRNFKRWSLVMITGSRQYL